MATRKQSAPRHRSTRRRTPKVTETERDLGPLLHALLDDLLRRGADDRAVKALRQLAPRPAKQPATPRTVLRRQLAEQLCHIRHATQQQRTTYGRPSELEASVVAYGLGLYDLICDDTVHIQQARDGTLQVNGGPMSQRFIAKAIRRGYGLLRQWVPSQRTLDHHAKAILHAQRPQQQS